MNKLILNNGIEIPPIGLGTAHPMTGTESPRIGGKLMQRLIAIFYYRVYSHYLVLKYALSLSKAIRMGYRLIDTSAAYNNEKCIKWGIKLSGRKREELFITTRVSNHQQWDGNIRGKLLQSLKAMNLKYIDLYMFHWPVTDVFTETWKQMEEIYKEGLAKTIGVANCHQHHLEALLSNATVIPAINQFEIHPLMSQKPLINFCKSKGIAVEAYTPIGRNHELLMNNELLKTIAVKYNKTIPQIILRWHYQNEIIPIPRSTNIKRLKQNISIFDFSLTFDEIEKINSINMNLRLRYDPDNCDFTKL